MVHSKIFSYEQKQSTLYHDVNLTLIFVNGLTKHEYILEADFLLIDLSGYGKMVRNNYEYIG